MERFGLSDFVEKFGRHMYKIYDTDELEPRTKAFGVLTEKYSYSDEEILAECLRVVSLAKRCNGVVFGGFVRDVIVPYQYLGVRLDGIDFKDMDFWFKKQEDADNFINMLNISNEPINKCGSESSYPFSTTKLLLEYKCNPFVFIDIIVFNIYPVCDFSVNLLSWDGSTLNVHQPYDIIELKPLEPSINYTIEEIINQIKTFEFDVCIPFKELGIQYIKNRYYQNEETNKLAIVAAYRLSSFKFNLANKRRKW